MTSPTDQYDVDTEALRTFADQLDMHADVHYFRIGEHGRTPERVLGVFSPGEPCAPMVGAMLLFLDDYTRLCEAEFGAFTRLADGMRRTSSALDDVALRYDQQEEANEHRLAQIHVSDAGPTGANPSQYGPRPTTQHTRRPAWRQPRHDPLSHLEHVDITNRGATIGTRDDAEERLKKLSLSLSGWLDTFVQSLTGFSMLKSFVIPLIGPWWLIEATGKYFSQKADAVGDVGADLRTGGDQLTTSFWSGAAADGFDRHITVASDVVDSHRDTLREAGSLLVRMGRTLDRDAEEIADGIEVVIDLAIEIASGVGLYKRGLQTYADYLAELAKAPRDVLAQIKGLFEAVKDVFETGWHLAEALDTLCVDIDPLVKSVHELDIPRTDG
ncbi:WXG100 family type VII secretion target [Actinophytocola sp. NPDC049390]|uniref:WXG100 family type VII secretion target n=1 Tax=Actinophytocola sp. NPDC049390 TaxID=3363894 RepID=UPI003798D66F